MITLQCWESCGFEVFYVYVCCFLSEKTLYQTSVNREPVFPLASDRASQTQATLLQYSVVSLF